MIYDANFLQMLIMIFGLTVGAIWLIYRAFRNNVRGKISKSYVGGEDIKEDVSVLPEGFYESMVRTLRVNRLRSLHNGDLSRYVIWIITGLSVFMIVLVWGLS